jgi:hypothetical protein
MTRIQKVYVRRFIALTIAVATFLAVLLIQNTFLVVTFNSGRAIRYMAMLFAGVGYILAWAISLMYKSNRDSAIHEMGDTELETYRAAIEQRIKDRKPTVHYDIKVDPAAKREQK